jgi:hypothetical protein
MTIVLAFIFVIAYISEAQIVEDGLVAYWPLDNDVKDIVGGHDGTIFGNPKTVPGKLHEALEFNGTSDWIEAEIPENRLKDGITLELWFLQDGPKKFGVKLKIDPDKAELNIDPERGGRSELWCYAARGIEGPDGLSDGKWHHAVGTVSKNRQVHYIDGVNVGENPNGVVFDVDAKVAIGRRPGTAWWWQGMLDEVRIYGRPLTEKEVKKNTASKRGLSVEPADKLAESWGNIKLQSR